MGRPRARSVPEAGLTLDTGALIAIERGDGRMVALLDRLAARGGARFAVPAAALAQAWRGAPRQARLARFLALPEVEVVPLDEPAARAVGVLCGAAQTADVVDAAVVLCARERQHRVVTSDPDDLGRLDPTLGLIAL